MNHDPQLFESVLSGLCQNFLTTTSHAKFVLMFWLFEETRSRVPSEMVVPGVHIEEVMGTIQWS